MEVDSVDEGREEVNALLFARDNHEEMGAQDQPEYQDYDSESECYEQVFEDEFPWIQFESRNTMCGKRGACNESLISETTNFCSEWGVYGVPSQD